MATAPNPKKLERDSANEQVQQLVWRMTVNDVEVSLHRADLGPADARLVRQATGARLVDVVNNSLSLQGDLDVWCVLWWLARRRNEPGLAYETAEAEFPSYEDDGFVAKIDLVDQADGDGSPEA